MAFEYFDIGESLLNLKQFLAIRETSEEFVRVRKEGRIGLPCIDMDGTIYVNDMKDFLDSL